ncbi:MAG: energy transducer TonB [Acidobacteriia bacterium]|nr:energy transducer TonB [Terriglobia bacterium]
MPHITFPARAFLAALLLFLAASPASFSAQAASPAPSTYPDTAGGLEKLAKDIFRAIKDGDTAAYGSLISSLAQPVPKTWYDDAFGDDGDWIYAGYSQNLLRNEHDLSEFFLKMRDEKAASPHARKHEAACDDNAGEWIYPVMLMRRNPVPLYELRLFSGDRFFRLWTLAYIDGGFRFVGNIHPPDSFPSSRKNLPPAEASSQDPSKRIRVGGNVTQAKIKVRVQPEYPRIAREERLQGTVNLHAIVGKDGSVKQLRVIKGYCSLAEAAVKAVSQWRYSPTLLLGQLVEVDTSIDVIFALNF